MSRQLVTNRHDRRMRAALCASICLIGTGLPARQPQPLSSLVVTAPQRLTAGAVTQPATVALSADGRFLAFQSDTSLLPADTNSYADVYVLDLRVGAFSLESRAWDGSAANGSSGHPSQSGDGRFIVFASAATNLVQAPNSGRSDVYLRDRERGTTQRISTGSNGGTANNWSSDPVISADASSIAFESAASNLTDVPDANGEVTDVYVFQRKAGQMDRVSVGAGGLQGMPASFGPAVSADGQTIAFTSRADFGCSGTPRRDAAHAVVVANVYVRDMRTRRTHCVSHSRDGSPSNGSSYHAAIDASGRRVAFASDATNLGVRDGNRATDVYLRDLDADTIMLVSRNAHGRPANGRSWRPAIAGDGSIIVFTTNASDLGGTRDCRATTVDANLVSDVYGFDAATRLTRRLSPAGCADSWWEPSQGPSLDNRGDVLAFSSRHQSSPEDTGHDDDAFVVRLEVPAPDRAAKVRDTAARKMVQ